MIIFIYLLFIYFKWSLIPTIERNCREPQMAASCQPSRPYLVIFNTVKGQHFESLDRQIVNNLIVGAVLAYVIRTWHVVEQLTEVCVLPVVDGLTY